MSQYFASLQRDAEQSGAPAPLERVTHLVAPRPAPTGPYELLYERLLAHTGAAGLKSLVFAGCRGGEGCSQTVRGLAQVIAAAGGTVLLVDFRVRGTPGASTISAAGTSRVLVPLAGRDRAHRFTSPEFRDWLDDQRRVHDVVLYDTPPILACADATVLGRLSDGVVLVVRADHTLRAALTEARQLLERAGVPMLGVVLNGEHDQVPSMLAPLLRRTC